MAQPENCAAVIIVRVWYDHGRFRSKIITIPNFDNPVEKIEYFESPGDVTSSVADHVQSFVEVRDDRESRSGS